jgi:SAM-dependent methyltransferase
MVEKAELWEEWSALSESVWGADFIKELAEHLNPWKGNVLEACCGSGHILHGLAMLGYSGVGFDMDTNLIKRAQTVYSHPAIRFEVNDIANVRDYEISDIVICRGNSLGSLTSWQDQKNFDVNVAMRTLYKSLDGLSSRVRPGGVLCVDTVATNEIRPYHEVPIRGPGISIDGEVMIDYDKRIRRTHGKGKVHGKDFEESTVGALVLVSDIKSYLGARGMTVWSVKLKSDQHYETILARA